MRVHEVKLKKSAGELVEPVYYVVGPPPMVEGMRRALEQAGVSDEDIRMEEFYGY